MALVKFCLEMRLVIARDKWNSLIVGIFLCDFSGEVGAGRPVIEKTDVRHSYFLFHASYVVASKTPSIFRLLRWPPFHLPLCLCLFIREEEIAVKHSSTENEPFRKGGGLGYFFMYYR